MADISSEEVLLDIDKIVIFQYWGELHPIFPIPQNKAYMSVLLYVYLIQNVSHQDQYVSSAKWVCVCNQLSSTLIATQTTEFT